MNILITSGGTEIDIDPVRQLKNFSTGKFGSIIATQALLAGHKVTHLCGPNAPNPFSFEVDLVNARGQDYASRLEDLHSFSRRYMSKYSLFKFRTYEDYAKLLKEQCTFFEFDAVILAAAVSDYDVEELHEKKIESKGRLALHFLPLPKLISSVNSWCQKPTKLVGFKLLNNVPRTDLITAASNSHADNGCHLVVANDLKDLKETYKTCYFVDKGSVTTLNGTSTEIAKSLIEALE